MVFVRNICRNTLHKGDNDDDDDDDNNNNNAVINNNFWKIPMFCNSKFPWARERISSKFIGNFDTRFQKKLASCDLFSQSCYCTMPCAAVDHNKTNKHLVFDIKYR